MNNLKKIFGWIIPLVAGVLGAIGGSSGANKAARRIGIPILVALFSLMCSGEIIASLWFCSLIGVYSLGYGIPDPVSGDEGSLLGRLWFKICKGNHFIANFFTRFTVGFLAGLSCIDLLIMNYSSYLLLQFGITVFGCAVINAVVNSFLNWIPEIKWGKWELLPVDFLSYMPTVYLLCRFILEVKSHAMLSIL